MNQGDYSDRLRDPQTRVEAFGRPKTRVPAFVDSEAFTGLVGLNSAKRSKAGAFVDCGGIYWACV